MLQKSRWTVEGGGRVKGGWVRLTKSDSQEEDQGMIRRLVYTYTNYERREEKRRGPR